MTVFTVCIWRYEHAIFVCVEVITLHVYIFMHQISLHLHTRAYVYINDAPSFYFDSSVVQEGLVVRF